MPVDRLILEYVLRDRSSGATRKIAGDIDRLASGTGRADASIQKLERDIGLLGRGLPKLRTGTQILEDMATAAKRLSRELNGIPLDRFERAGGGSRLFLPPGVRGAAAAGVGSLGSTLAAGAAVGGAGATGLLGGTASALLGPLAIGVVVAKLGHSIAEFLGEARDAALTVDESRVFLESVRRSRGLSLAEIAGIRESFPGNLPVGTTNRFAARLLGTGISTGTTARIATQVSSLAIRANFSEVETANRLANAIAKLEVEQLDELNIVARLNVATKAYAKKLGLSSDALLTIAQRQEAFALAVAEAAEQTAGLEGAVSLYSRSAREAENASLRVAESVGGFFTPFLTELNKVKARSFDLAGGLFESIGRTAEEQATIDARTRAAAEVIQRPRFAWMAGVGQRGMAWPSDKGTGDTPEARMARMEWFELNVPSADDPEMARRSGFRGLEHARRAFEAAVKNEMVAQAHGERQVTEGRIEQQDAKRAQLEADLQAELAKDKQKADRIAASRLAQIKREEDRYEASKLSLTKSVLHAVGPGLVMGWGRQRRGIVGSESNFGLGASTLVSGVDPTGQGAKNFAEIGAARDAELKQKEEREFLQRLQDALLNFLDANERSADEQRQREMDDRRKEREGEVRRAVEESDTIRRQRAGGFLDAAISAPGGVRDFFRDQALDTLFGVFENVTATTSLFGGGRLPGQIKDGELTSLGKMLKGTPLGLSPEQELGVQHLDPLRLSVDSLRVAVEGNTVVATSGVAVAKDAIGTTTPLAEAVGEAVRENGFRLARDLPGLLAAGGFGVAGIRAGASQGGVGGALTAAGGVGKAATSIIGAFAKEGSALAGIIPGLGAAFMAVSLIGSFFGGDSAEDRRRELERDIRNNQLQIPDSRALVTDRFGNELGYDSGGARVVQINIAQSIDTIDAQSFIDHSDDVAEATRVGLQSNTALMDEIRERI